MFIRISEENLSKLHYLTHSDKSGVFKKPILLVLVSILIFVTAACEDDPESNPELEIFSPSLPAPEPFAWQYVPYPIDVMVRNNGSTSTTVHTAYTAELGDDPDYVRLGPRVTLPPGSVKPVRMYFDVRPEWTEDDRFRATFFLSDPERDGTGREGQIYIDENLGNHTFGLEFAVKPLYRKVRLTVTRLRLVPGVPEDEAGEWLFTMDFIRQHPVSGDDTVDETLFWPENLIALTPGEWVDVDISHVFETRGPLFIDRISINERLGLDVHVQYSVDEVSTAGISALSTRYPSSTWSNPETVRTVFSSGSAYSTPPQLEFELKFEGVEQLVP